MASPNDRHSLTSWTLVREKRQRTTRSGVSNWTMNWDIVPAQRSQCASTLTVTEALSFYIGNSQCRHIILGCCHDSGYAPALGEFAAEPSSRDRITLLKGSSIHPRIQDLGFTKTLQLESVFALPEGTIPSLPDKPTPPPPSRRFWNPLITPDMLGPVLRNKNGQRVDKVLNVSSDSQHVKSFRRAKLCYYYYLRGECSGCGRNHRAPQLKPAEYEALWFLARQGFCVKGGDCDDPKCIYSHKQA